MCADILWLIGIGRPASLFHSNVSVYDSRIMFNFQAESSSYMSSATHPSMSSKLLTHLGYVASKVVIIHVSCRLLHEYHFRNSVLPGYLSP